MATDGACDAKACISALGEGEWMPHAVWRSGAPRCCGFTQIGPRRAAELLRGRRIAFIGDSQSRRHMWAVVDAVAGPQRAIRRQAGRVVPDSTAHFDRAAVTKNDTVYDSQRAYHAGQTVLLNVDSGRFVLLDPGQLCGVERKYWMSDHRLVGALEAGKSMPWHVMRGALIRLRLVVSSSGRGRTPAASNVSTAAAIERPGGGHAQRLRRAVEAYARQAMLSWGCQKENIRDCSYPEAIQRNCARRLAVQVEKGRRRPAAASGAQESDDHIHLLISMGDMGGTCMAAAKFLQRSLEAKLGAVAPDGPRHGPRGAAAGPLVAGRRLLRSSIARRGAGAQRQQQPPHLPPTDLSGVARVGRVALDPVCVDYCRETRHLECPRSGPTYEAAVRRAVALHAEKLGNAPSSLALLTFIYGASMEGDMMSTFTRWRPHTYGHGAESIILGATWASVMHTRDEAVAPGGSSATETKRLQWDRKLAKSWQKALSACTATGASCLLRTVPSNLRQSSAQPYLDFRAHVTPVAETASVAVLDNFAGTRAGVRLGVMAHHDSTRIHFSDTGRAFLAQLTLNALRWLLDARNTTRTTDSHREGERAASGSAVGTLRLADLVPVGDL